MHTLYVYYRPDNYPEWVFWRKFEERFTLIGRASALDAGGLPTARAGFAPRVDFGKPSDECDPNSTNRRLRRGYQFQIRLKGTGHVSIDRLRVHAQTTIEKSTANC